MYLERREEFPGPIFLCSLALDRSFVEEELPEVQREHNDEGKKAIPKNRDKSSLGLNSKT